MSKHLILASKSASRRAMLDAAGVAYDSIPADIDERAVEAGLEGTAPAEVAEALAVAKAAAVAAQHPGALVLGSDSLVVAEGRRFDKPRSAEEAAEHLRFFSGKVMELHSAAALVRDGGCEWSHVSIARLHVRELSEEFIAHYLKLEWPAIGHTVGAFRIEGPGVQLFDGIEGDQFTVLGMPLIPLLAALREEGVLIA
ncbi:septum formation protein [Erythromicrobium ramosum]|uniref:Nucleoside triphosphate pyrophosphatase n=1 Tax=Erythrobacter ramosus TaxID=35811 RepID=A0A6I4UK30_9SPHN|nr:Maf family nucleotide pyrophosphatase [Erythrobacter ramosus]MBB3774666.1 septum formation protein [Erythrobacter ramosus]MXP37689.1 septum formation protein Maf [Erythrobacter ramosus]